MKNIKTLAIAPCTKPCLCALRAAVVGTDAHRAGFHVATADDQP